eukprot:5917291-Lingulodinium_polyedra.AAC.1
MGGKLGVKIESGKEGSEPVQFSTRGIVKRFSEMGVLARRGQRAFGAEAQQKSACDRVYSAKD